MSIGSDSGNIAPGIAAGIAPGIAAGRFAYKSVENYSFLFSPGN